ncbi:uncharacterized protein MELLADRAFT_109238 [Melampsora larici-populina 98AG31]|uniref:CMP/dCMP-type deaminase domain-containing protein n=1 Tax=Melampsora larici-populina (strain 98AG31 / pathotype 3-4-7) TaxID=747676 RepID=F4RVU1_MELLP|nr:uncharacterized protein MELLADRAFT_109238 [Melampsora larici-populina 98AG31]EGG03416.1 hypothetical protein MELLADRAFT_109238 [Melampsora larici-populina 98AG31]
MDQPTTQTTSPKEWFPLALQEATKCVPSPQAFNIGSLILSSSNQLLSKGHSRELPGNTHAEENALSKLTDLEIPDGSLKLVVTMEPCSVRLSGKTSCVDKILEWNDEHREKRIGEVWLGVLEPKDFVVCEGVRKLKEMGILVGVIEGFEDECLRIARMK